MLSTQALMSLTALPLLPHLDTLFPVLPLWHTMPEPCPDRKEGRNFLLLFAPIFQTPRTMSGTSCSVSNNWLNEPISDYLVYSPMMSILRFFLTFQAPMIPVQQLLRSKGQVSSLRNCSAETRHGRAAQSPKIGAALSSKIVAPLW